MRINVYAEELTDDVELTQTTADTGRTFYGVRFFLASSDKLHHTPRDDDRSAVTFWVPDNDADAENLARSLEDAAELIRGLVQ